MKNCYPDFVIPKHGDLSGWARQGVLLLNACLTVQAHKANSHANHGWEKLTDASIKVLNDKFNNIVFLLWGAYAHKKADFIDQVTNQSIRNIFTQKVEHFFCSASIKF